MQRNYYLSILFFLLFCSISHLSASQWTVNSKADAGAGSLREHIENAADGDSVYFAIRDGIVLDSTLFIKKSLHFFGPGADSLFISGGEKVRIMKVDTATVVYFENITFKNGNALLDSTDLFSDGGVLRNFGKASFKNCLFLHNYGGYGAAISNSGGQGRNAELFLNNCAFIQNYATPARPNVTLTPKSGGAIFSDGRSGGRSKVVAINCTFSGNEGTDRGGAIMHYQDMGDSTRSIVLIHCTITNNSSLFGAGGVDVTQFGLTSYTNTLVADNKGALNNPDVFGNLTSFGGLLVGKVTFNSSIGDNLMPDDLVNVDAQIGPLGYYGGSPIPSHALKCNSPAIDKGVASSYSHDQTGRARIGASDLGAFERNAEEDRLILNKNDEGAGSLRFAVINACGDDTLDLGGFEGSIYLDSEIHIDKDLTFFGNPDRVLWLRASGKNRHLIVDTMVQVSLKNLSFAEGKPEQAGGGAILNKGRLYVEACTFANNQAISGGAIANYGEGGKATLNLLNSTFSNNRATILDGGAIDNYSFTDSAFVESNHCTFVYNEAKKRGGAIFSNADAIFFTRNSIIADNRADEGQEVFGVTVSRGHNLLKANSQAHFSRSAGDILGMDPKIGGLKNHGGGSYTHALLAGSPAIDSGDNEGAPSYDQRAYARMFNATVDIGAYEYDPATDLEDEFVGKIQMYPNPARDFVYISFPADAVGPSFGVSIYNIRNQLIRNFQSTSSATAGPHRLDVSSLESGFYFLLISDGKNQSIHKLILQ